MVATCWGSCLASLSLCFSLCAVSMLLLPLLEVGVHLLRGWKSYIYHACRVGFHELLAPSALLLLQLK